MSVGSKDRVETNGQTDRRTDRQTKGNDYITFPTNTVGKDLDFCTKINFFSLSRIQGRDRSSDILISPSMLKFLPLVVAV